MGREWGGGAGKRWGAALRGAEASGAVAEVLGVRLWLYSPPTLPDPHFPFPLPPSHLPAPGSWGPPSNGSLRPCLLVLAVWPDRGHCRT